MKDRARFPCPARADFLVALDGIDLSPSEQRIVDWLLGWDQPALNALADIIRKARAEGVGTGAGGGDDRAKAEATLRDNRSVDCPEAPAQAHPLADFAESWKP